MIQKTAFYGLILSALILYAEAKPLVINLEGTINVTAKIDGIDAILPGISSTIIVKDKNELKESLDPENKKVTVDIETLINFLKNLQKNSAVNDHQKNLIDFENNEKNKSSTSGVVNKQSNIITIAPEIESNSASIMPEPTTQKTSTEPNTSNSEIVEEMQSLNSTQATQPSKPTPSIPSIPSTPSITLLPPLKPSEPIEPIKSITIPPIPPVPSIPPIFPKPTILPIQPGWPTQPEWPAQPGWPSQPVLPIQPVRPTEMPTETTTFLDQTEVEQGTEISPYFGQNKNEMTSTLTPEFSNISVTDVTELIIKDKPTESNLSLTSTDEVVTEKELDFQESSTVKDKTLVLTETPEILNVTEVTTDKKELVGEKVNNQSTFESTDNNRIITETVETTTEQILEEQNLDVTSNPETSTSNLNLPKPVKSNEKEAIPEQKNSENITKLSTKTTDENVNKITITPYPEIDSSSITEAVTLTTEKTSAENNLNKLLTPEVDGNKLQPNETNHATEEYVITATDAVTPQIFEVTTDAQELEKNEDDNSTLSAPTVINNEPTVAVEISTEKIIEEQDLNVTDIPEITTTTIVDEPKVFEHTDKPKEVTTVSDQFNFDDSTQISPQINAKTSTLAPEINNSSITEAVEIITEETSTERNLSTSMTPEIDGNKLQFNETNHATKESVVTTTDAVTPQIFEVTTDAQDSQKNLENNYTSSTTTVMNNEPTKAVEISTEKIIEEQDLNVTDIPEIATTAIVDLPKVTEHTDKPKEVTEIPDHSNSDDSTQITPQILDEKINAKTSTLAPEINNSSVTEEVAIITEETSTEKYFNTSMTPEVDGNKLQFNETSHAIEESVVTTTGPVTPQIFEVTNDAQDSEKNLENNYTSSTTTVMNNEPTEAVEINTEKIIEEQDLNVTDIPEIATEETSTEKNFNTSMTPEVDGNKLQFNETNHATEESVVTTTDAVTPKIIEVTTDAQEFEKNEGDNSTLSAPTVINNEPTVAVEISTEKIIEEQDLNVTDIPDIATTAIVDLPKVIEHTDKPKDFTEIPDQSNSDDTTQVSSQVLEERIDMKTSTLTPKMTNSSITEAVEIITEETSTEKNFNTSMTPKVDGNKLQFNETSHAIEESVVTTKDPVTPQTFEITTDAQDSEKNLENNYTSSTTTVMNNEPTKAVEISTEKIIEEQDLNVTHIPEIATTAIVDLPKVTEHTDKPKEVTEIPDHSNSDDSTQITPQILDEKINAKTNTLAPEINNSSVTEEVAIITEETLTEKNLNISSAPEENNNKLQPSETSHDTEKFVITTVGSVTEKINDINTDAQEFEKNKGDNSTLSATTVINNEPTEAVEVSTKMILKEDLGVTVTPEIATTLIVDLPKVIEHTDKPKEVTAASDQSNNDNTTQVSPQIFEEHVDEKTGNLAPELYNSSITEKITIITEETSTVNNFNISSTPEADDNKFQFSETNNATEEYVITTAGSVTEKIIEVTTDAQELEKNLGNYNTSTVINNEPTIRVEASTEKISEEQNINVTATPEIATTTNFEISKPIRTVENASISETYNSDNVTHLPPKILDQHQENPTSTLFPELVFDSLKVSTEITTQKTSLEDNIATTATPEIKKIEPAQPIESLPSKSIVHPQPSDTVEKEQVSSTTIPDLPTPPHVVSGIEEPINKNIIVNSTSAPEISYNESVVTVQTTTHQENLKNQDFNANTPEILAPKKPNFSEPIESTTLSDQKPFVEITQAPSQSFDSKKDEITTTLVPELNKISDSVKESSTNKTLTEQNSNSTSIPEVAITEKSQSLQPNIVKDEQPTPTAVSEAPKMPDVVVDGQKSINKDINTNSTFEPTISSNEPTKIEQSTTEKIAASTSKTINNETKEKIGESQPALPKVPILPIIIPKIPSEPNSATVATTPDAKDSKILATNKPNDSVELEKVTTSSPTKISSTTTVNPQIMEVTKPTEKATTTEASKVTEKAPEVKGLVDSLKENINKSVENAKQGASNKLEVVKEKVTSFVGNVKKKASDAWNKFIWW